MNWRNNEYVARCAADHPGRFYPFGLLPHPGSDDPVAAVRRLKREFGCRGVKVIPSWQGWRLDDSSLDPVWRAMVEEDLILMTHTDHPFLPPEGHDPPHALLAVIRRHPELRVLAPHLGGMLAIYALHPPLRPLLANTLFVCSVPATMRMTLYAIDAAGPDNVAFGTDFPFNPSHDQRTVRRAFEALPMDEEIRAAVAGGNAARFLAG
jgi:predicted TIM-barrel fold metal-dependent hydrolase